MGREAVAVPGWGRVAWPWTARAIRFVAIVLALAAGATLVTLWPGFALVLLAVASVVALAVFRPAYALAVAVVLWGAEGTGKVLLSLGDAPLPGSPEAIVGAALDVALIAAIAGIALGARERSILAQRSLLEIVAALLTIWLVVSLGVLFAGGKPGAGVLGLAVLAGVIALVLRSSGAIVSVRQVARRNPLEFAAILLGTWLVVSLGILFAAGRGAAGVLGLAVLATVVAIVVRARAVDIAALRDRADGFVVVAAVLGAWFVMSLGQGLGSGSDEGLAGFRLAAGYLLVAAAVVAFVPLAAFDERFVRFLLAGLAVIAGYAGLRALFGPLEAERAYVLLRGHALVPGGGDPFWTVGSFSGPLALASFLVPAAVFAATIAILESRYRRVGLAVAVPALGALAASHVRMAIAAVGVGAAATAVLALWGRRLSPRRKAAVIVAALAVLVGATGVLVGVMPPAVQERVEARLDVWGDTVASLGERPFGTGLGTFGGAAASPAEPRETLEGSYLKAVSEQGLVGLLFVAGIVGACALVFARLLRRPPERRAPLAVAAASAFVAFSALAVFRPAFDQPGKVLAWALLGVALLHLGRRDRASAGEHARRLSYGNRSRGSAAVWVMLVACLALAPAVLAGLRTASYESAVLVDVYAGKRLPTLDDRVEHLKALVVGGHFSGLIAETGGVVVDPATLHERVDVAAVRGLVEVRFTADTPEHARDLANAAGSLFELVSGGEIAVLERAYAPPLDSALDRVLAPLGGAMPPPPHPVLVAAVGFVAAALVYAAWLATRDRRLVLRRRRIS